MSKRKQPSTSEMPHKKLKPDEADPQIMKYFKQYDAYISESFGKEINTLKQEITILRQNLSECKQEIVKLQNVKKHDNCSYIS